MFMEQNLDVVWTCLLRAALILAFSITTSMTAPRPPRLIGCVFQERANVTCHWEAGDTPATHYTLEVKQKPLIDETSNNPLNTFTCTTSETSCTAITNLTARLHFCITITAHDHSKNISSQRPCQSGRAEVMLPPVALNCLKPVDGRPHCLNVIWTPISTDLPVSSSEIRAGRLKSQIEFTAQGQADAQVKNVNATDKSFLVCLFRPYTSYNIRLRHSYQSQQGPQSPWSLWSTTCTGLTGEDAPSAAPAFWRRVKQTDKHGWRYISLLWKPLPRHLANGRVLFFNVTCQTEGAQILNNLGSCRYLHNTSTSCYLRLPAGRCSCSLTASTSVGTSPKAWIWLPGAFEKEPPPPSQIKVTPLDDSSLNVRWTAPVDQPTSGFVVEWYAVREKNSSVHHWKKLNGSCTALIITEGVKPMERYVVSVRALFGERGAGKNKTDQVYTRQGTPSDGPEVQVQKISGSTVELSWSPVPVELLRGFIRNYTLSYSTANQPARRVLVPAHVHSYSLRNLLPGNYDIFMQANTDAGAGAAGPVINVHISEDSEEISMVIYALLPIMLTSLAVVMMVCLAQSKIVKQKLCQDVPDPSNSSLVHWTQKSTLEIMKWPVVGEKDEIKYSQVVPVGDSELQNLNPDKNLNYQSLCNLQTYFTHCRSPLPVSMAQTAQNDRRSESCIKSSTGVNSNTNSDLSICPYSNIHFSQTPESLPAPLISSFYLQWQQSTVSVNDIKLQLDGGSEPYVSVQGGRSTRSDSPRSQTHEPRNSPHFLKQHQSPVSFSDFSNICYSSVLLSHPAAVTSAQNPFSQSLHNSVQSLQSDTSALSTTSLSPFPPSVFVDLSYCPLQCDPYVSSEV